MEQKKNNQRATLIGGLIALVVIVIVVLLIVWLRGCSPVRTPNAGRAPGQASTPSADVSAATLEDKVHTALHTKSLANGNPLDTLVYIFRVSTDHGVAVSITLTPLAGIRGATPQSIAAACENAVMAAVPEVTSVAVVDANNVAVGTVTRK